MPDEKTEFSPEEQRQRDVLLRRLLKTPPKPRPKRERGEKTKRQKPVKAKPAAAPDIWTEV